MPEINVVTSQTESMTIERLRRGYEEALQSALASGEIPDPFKGDPTFENALKRRIKEST